MLKRTIVGINVFILFSAIAFGVAYAQVPPPPSPFDIPLTVERSADRMSATATWTPNQGAEYQGFFIVAKLFASEPDTAGYGVKIDTFRYVDWPLAGDVGSLVITGLDPSRDYIYGVISTARDSSGNWVWSAWEIVQDTVSIPPAQSSPTASVTPSTTPISAPTPDASLALEVEAEVAGYYSNGQAGVDLSLSLMDTAHPWREGAQTISIVCRQGSEVVEGCGDELEVTLPGDGQAATASAALRTPMGSVSLEFNFGGIEPLTLPFDVPQHIVDVERDVWECFRDEPNTLEPSEDDRGYFGDCAGWGWGNPAMWKWNQDIPVNVWTTGREDYIATLEETLHELSPLLDLDFAWVDSERDATLKAYMGIPKSQVVSAGFPKFCAGEYTLGCGGPDWITHSGVVESGAFGVWRYLDESGWWTDVGLLDTLIKHVTVHEALHALVPMAHRTDPASIMSTRKSLSLPTLSRMDEDLIRLHQHRLVEPGMSMSEIERLIVFREDLLDSPPPRKLDGYELVRSAFGRLQEADSARFRISGGWKSPRCNHLFGWANYEIGDFGSSVARLVHFEDGRKSHFIIVPKSGDGEREYWIEESGQWKEVGQDIFSDNTSWRQGFSSPHVMLASVLFFSDADDIGVSKNRDGSITLRVRLDDAYARVSWSKGETLRGSPDSRRRHPPDIGVRGRVAFRCSGTHFLPQIHH